MSDTKQLAFTAAQIDAILAAAQMHSNRNLLDNWDFRNPVNQRNVSGTIDTAGYFLDRWKLESGSVTIGNNGITLNGTIVQILETAVGTDVTASALTDEAVVAAYYDNDSKTISLTGTGQTFAAAKLELGPAQTLAHQDGNGNWVLNEIPDYGEQLRKCQRYFYSFNFEDWPGVGTYWGRGNSNTEIELYNLIFPVTMREPPSENLFRVYDIGSGETFDVASNGFYRKREGLRAIGVISGMTVEVGKVYAIIKARFSADL